jgi:hypothetical protein
VGRRRCVVNAVSAEEHGVGEKAFEALGTGWTEGLQPGGVDPSTQEVYFDSVDTQELLSPMVTSFRNCLPIKR